MPYDIKKQADGYHVFNQQTGEDKGKSPTRAKAEAHMRALYANEPGKPSTSPGTLAATTPPTALDDTYTPRPITHAFMGGKRYIAGGVVNRTAGQSSALGRDYPASLDTHGSATESIPSRDPDLHGSVGGKVGLPATGDGKTDAGLGAGIIAAVTDKVSNTNDKERKASRAPASDVSDHDPHAFKRGGILSRIAKKVKKGGLHESLGVPEGQTIPAGEVAAAAKRPGKVGRQARLAETFAKARNG